VPPAARPKKLSFKEQREFEDLPARIEALEDEQRRLTQESESAEFYKAGADHIRTVLSRLAALPGELEETLRRWLELEDRAQRR
jgi:ATP-binding cassette subfamily F protein uup